MQPDLLYSSSETGCQYRYSWNETPLKAEKGIRRFVDRFLREVSCDELQGAPVHAAPPTLGYPFSVPGTFRDFNDSPLYLNPDLHRGHSSEETGGFKLEWLPLLNGLELGAVHYASPSEESSGSEEMLLCPEVQASFPDS